MTVDHLPDAPRIARFGVFEYDFASGQLRRDGVAIRLQDQPARLLAYLLERPGGLVTREELQSALWPSDFVDFDHSLNAAIRKLRIALDDDADNPRFIETRARRGYRFIAPVERTEKIRPATPASPARPATRRAFIPIAILFIVAASSIFFLNRSARRPSFVGSIAVLPFENDDRASEQLSDGLAEVLIDNLSRQPDLRVMARASVVALKEKVRDPLRVGRELGVDAIVTGDVTHAEGKQLLHVELIDVRDGAQVWGDRYEWPRSDLRTVPSRIIAELSQRLRPRAAQPAPHSSTRSAEAYELYLRGLYVWNARLYSKLPDAVTDFQRAIELDPEYADAYGALANTYGIMIGTGMISAEEGAPKVLAAAHKALELDPRNARAYAAIAATESRTLWKFDAANRDFQKAIELNPSFASAHIWYGQNLASIGKFAEARLEIDRAYQLDPLSLATAYGQCCQYVTERRYSEAVAFMRSAPRPGSACVVESFLAADQIENAIDELARGIVSPAQAAALRDAYRRSGKEGFLEERLAQLMEQPNLEVETAETFAMLDRKDEAFAWLEKGFGKHVTPIASYHLLPGFDGIRSDPRFNGLARRVGIPQAALDAVNERASAAGVARR